MSRSRTPETASPFDSAGKHVIATPLQDEVSSSFLEYAYSVIHSRALPDARDGLKPVHRRILFSMGESGLRPDHAYVKSARVVGDVMGRLHPHGDSAIYEALVRLAQDFAMTTPVVDGHGNYGSPNDPPAAARYCVVGDTRIRLADGTTPTIAEVVDLPADSEADADFEVLDKDGQPVRVTRVFNSGVHPTLAVATRMGYSVRGSENHLVLTLQEVAGVPLFQWMRLDELKPGMYLAVARNAAVSVIPTARDYMLGVLLGGWVTEGWANDNRAGFNNTDKAFFDEVLLSYDALVGGRRYVYDRHTRRDRKRIYELDVQNLAEFRNSPLAHAVGVRSAQKVVPDAVWNGSAGVKRAFLMAAFEGDGGVRGGKAPWTTYVVQYSSYSEPLVDGIQQLLLEFGITAIKRSYVRASGKTEWRLIISGIPAVRAFSERVGFLPTKQASLNAALVSMGTKTGLGHDKVPFVTEYVRSEAPRGGRVWLNRNSIAYPHRWQAHKMMIRSKIRSDEVMSVIEPIMESGYRFDPVVSVERCEPAEVYSVRVASDDHSFLAGPFVNHNTECRMSPFAMLMVGELGEDTVDFAPNYDGSLDEPVVLPAAYPFLLVNGSAGIAVGMATKMIPHNLGEAVAAARLLLKKPKATLDEVMAVLPGPDLPTGGVLIGLDQVREAYATGRGTVRIRARAEVGPLEGSRGRFAITVTELPYEVGTERIIEAIKAEIGKKRLAGISDVKDLSDRIHGTRLVIECKAGVNPQALLAELYRFTPMETSFGIANLALVDGQPQTLGLVRLLQVFLAHRVDVVRRRTQYRLTKAEERKHVVDGLLLALDNIDAVVKIIRASKDTSIARDALIKKFKFSDIQAGVVLDMPLRRLVALEVDTLRKELADLLATIGSLRAILDDEKTLRGVVDKELAAVAAAHAVPRRTTLVDGDLKEVLAASAPTGPLEVADDPCQVLLSATGLLARTAGQSEEAAEGRRRSGRAKHDTIAAVVPATARGQVLLITNRGRAFKVDVLSLPTLPEAPGTVSLRGGVSGREVAAMTTGEFPVGLAPLGGAAGTGSPGLALGTRQGTVKVTAPDWPARGDDFDVIALKPGDEVVTAAWLTDGTEEIAFLTSEAQLLHFPARNVRPQGRSGGGIVGVALPSGASVLAFAAVRTDDATHGEPMVVTYSGVSAKVTPLSAYPGKGRGTGGVRAQTFRKDESRLAAGWIGPRPVGSTSRGEPVALPAVNPKRDASGSPVDDLVILGHHVER